MAITTPQGFKVLGPEGVEFRACFPTKADALVTTSYGSGGTGLPMTSRFEGLTAWIIDEQMLYVFVGGVTNAHFVPITSVPAFMQAVVKEIRDNYLEEFFNTETLEKLTELLKENDEFKSEFWSKEDLRVMDETTYGGVAPGSLPEGTVVMVKESV